MEIKSTVSLSVSPPVQWTSGESSMSWLEKDGRGRGRGGAPSRRTGVAPLVNPALTLNHRANHVNLGQLPSKGRLVWDKRAAMSTDNRVGHR
ncbi:hypothetical protein ElyMa_004090600 [Elysia marginata]|uniref:Uncharacterized protein n=1 Tax=Elysia marginata TaxID=1093978 RepID=A0AAV4G9B2_9GAST|nr:hypothetical protein ElyMa_004090600 [Elysia marginata]